MKNLLKTVALMLLLSLCLGTLASCSVNEIVNSVMGMISGTEQPVACEHEWTDATCTSPKTCTKCGETEGEALEHKDENKDHACDNGCSEPMGTHAAAEKSHVCSYCEKPASSCVDADTNHACDVCETEMGTHEDANKDHACDYGCSVSMGTHEENNEHKCTYCGKSDETWVCRGGEATCTAQAVCEICGKSHGDTAAHSYVLETVKDEALKSAATCDSAAVYYKSCSCGAVSSSDSETFTSGEALVHAWDNVCDTECNNGCGETRESSHEYESVVTAPTYDAEGYTTHTCTVCGDSYTDTATEKLVAVESISFASSLFNLVLGVNESVELEVTVLPENAYDKTLTWTSTDDSIASVENGVITAHKEGFVNIIATDVRGKVTKKAFIYVTSHAIDGDISEEIYSSVIPSFSERADRTQETRLVFGEGGFYISYDVVDGNMKETSHIELYIALGDASKEIGSSYELRFYPLNSELLNGAVYAWDGSAWSGVTSSFRMYTRTVPVTDADGNNVGYTVEGFIPYTSLGLTKAPESVKMLSVQFYWTSTGTAISSGHSNEIAFKSAHLDDLTYYKTYDKNGFVDDVTVEVAFDNGIIANTGNSTSATVGQYLQDTTTTNKNSTSFVSTDTMTFTTGIDGDENGAAITNHKTGPYTVVSGVTLGTGDFTVSAWINIPDISKVTVDGNSTYIFGSDKVDEKTDPSFSVKLRYGATTVDGVKQSTGILYLNGRSSATQATTFSNEVSIQSGNWYLITVVRQGTNMLYYCGNTLIGSHALASGLDYGKNDIAFGGHITETWPYNDNTIYYDNIRVYNRSLAPAEIGYICETEAPQE